MKIGVVFPQTEIGPDVGAVRAYGQCADQLGYHHVLAFDHVVGADPAIHRGWKGPHDVRTQFHEPFVLFGFLAGITSLQFTTGVLILPQRETVLVAKQAAGRRGLESGGVRGARAGLRRAGRPPGRADDLAEQAVRWPGAGATHVSLNTMNAALATPDAHLAALASAAEVLFGS